MVKYVPCRMRGNVFPGFLYLPSTSVTEPQIKQTTSERNISFSWFRLLMRPLVLALLLKIHLNSGEMARKYQYSFYWILGRKWLAQSVDSETKCSFIKSCKKPVFIWKDKQNQQQQSLALEKWETRGRLLFSRSLRIPTLKLKYD